MDADEDEDSEPVQLNANGNPIKRRLRANREQLRVLESVFDQNRTPSPGFKKDLAKRLGMPHKSILYWFQNRRAMLAREQKRLHTGQVGVTSMQGSEDAAEEELDGEGDESSLMKMKEDMLKFIDRKNSGRIGGIAGQGGGGEN
ncbi:hypothetical protein BC830DRAFT_442823 [Chytriomyces sp. MP71]|nr:hypothetical protein BC830DRAFT_442823 [Chytriomyces sp. MP71]